VASRLQSCVRKSDTTARLGGDEFAIILTQVVNKYDATNIAEKMVSALKEPFEIDNQMAIFAVKMQV